jgi:hypothetical protein
MSPLISVFICTMLDCLLTITDFVFRDGMGYSGSGHTRNICLLCSYFSRKILTFCSAFLHSEVVSEQLQEGLALLECARRIRVLPWVCLDGFWLWLLVIHSGLQHSSLHMFLSHQRLVSFGKMATL